MKTFLSVFVGIFLLFASHDVLGFSGGNGSAGDPFQIASKADLDIVNNDLSAHYVLIADVNMAPALYGGSVYTSAVIAPDEIPSTYDYDGLGFSGTFDGAGYRLLNLTISTLADSDPTNDKDDFLALVGWLTGIGRVTNVIIENGSVTSTIDTEFAAGICGWNDGGTIDNCQTSCTITGGYSLGGICGWSEGGIITDCTASGDVIGGDDAFNLGGICGASNEGGMIINCHATGNISGLDDPFYLGGVCGYNYLGDLINCSATGNITGGDYLFDSGGLCGYHGTGVIANCSATGNVTGGDDAFDLGGLCGYAEGGFFANCYAEGDVIGGVYAWGLGGFCGWNEYCCVSNCYATGDLAGDVDAYWLGGFCGYSSGNITNSYAMGNITTTLDSFENGGFCGFNDYATISHCYATGSVFNSSDCGGFCGGSGYGAIVNCFWNTDNQTGGVTTGVGYNDPGITIVFGQTTAEMQTQSTFTDAAWDFVGESVNGLADTWIMPSGQYPKFRLFETGPYSYASGSGIQADPYRISTIAELCAMQDYPVSAFKLDNDIDLSSMVFSRAVVPVFAGTLNGAGHVLDSLEIDSLENCLGLFGTTRNTMISNLGIENCSISCGYADDSYSLGGISGDNYGTIENCYVTGSFSGAEYLGGICGYNESGNLSNCYTAVTLTGTNYLGGVLGYNYEGSLQNSYAVGDVIGSNYLGGISGYNNDGDILSCFWNTDTQTGGVTLGVGSSSGGTVSVTALKTLELKTQNTFTDAGWDFVGDSVGDEDSWRMCVDGVDYPKFWWEYIPGDLACGDNVTLVDFAVLAGHWLTEDGDAAWYDNTDVNFDGQINLDDLLIFCDNWQVAYL